MLEFKNVDINVGKTSILKNISVEFETGKITSIIGPNGCGKTTLLQTLNGISKVVSGQILLEGQSFLELSYKERAKRLSFLPQLRENSPSISVKGLVEHGRFPYMGFSRKMSEEDEKAVYDALEFVSLYDYRNQLVSELSGGLQQRVYLAMQLAQNSRYMVMDEPMNYLDFPAQREMYQLMKKLKARGKTIILVLHDLGQTLQISDNIVVMDDRKIMGTGTVKECMQSDIIRKVFKCEISEVDIDGSHQYVFT
ncbi:MAG: ABC transporter ATP-binding protein [Acetatifactor sp.]|nr:ABC transporter ATP-binding protein [Acetatifactor sp.]